MEENQIFNSICLALFSQGSTTTISCFTWIISLLSYILLWAFADFQELLSDPWMNSQHRIIEKYECAAATAAFVIKLKGASKI